MPVEADIPPARITSSNRATLRRCLFNVAERLYANGYVLETITLPTCGLTTREMVALAQDNADWAACCETLKTSAAGAFNGEGRFVLTAHGREIMFDLFGQGAADCA